MPAPPPLFLEGSFVDRWKAARAKDLYAAACWRDPRVAHEAAALENSSREIRSIFSDVLYSMSSTSWANAFVAPFHREAP